MKTRVSAHLLDGLRLARFAPSEREAVVHHLEKIGHGEWATEDA